MRARESRQGFPRPNSGIRSLSRRRVTDGGMRVEGRDGDNPGVRSLTISTGPSLFTFFRGSTAI